MTQLTKIYALFNRENKEFSTWIFDISTIPEDVRKTLLLREVILEEHGIYTHTFDPERYRWVGDYDQGRFQDLLEDNVAIVTEKQIIQKYAEIFLRKYSLNDIWDYIKNSQAITEESKDFQKFTEMMLSRMQNDIEFYKTSGVHEYITTEEFNDKQEKAFHTE